MRNLAEGERDKLKTVAEGQKEQTILAAEGQAQAIALEAQAQAEALKLIAEALAQNPDLLTYEYIDKLSPNIRAMLVPNNAPLILPLQDLVNDMNVDGPNATGAVTNTVTVEMEEQPVLGTPTANAITPETLVIPEILATPTPTATPQEIEAPQNP